MNSLDAVERVARASKFSRLFARPWKYGFAMFFNKLVYPFTQKGVLKKADTFFGRSLHVLLPAGTDIYLAGGKTHYSEIRLAKFLIRTLKKGDVFIDIGAHFGYFSLLASRLVNTGKVYAFEASGNSFEILQKNVAEIPNIHAIHKAVSDHTEPVEFYELPVVYSEYNTTEPGQFEKEAWYLKIKPEKKMVESATLDGFSHDITPGPVLIKIDVEGAEFKVIKGGGVYLKNHSPVVIMEYLEDSRSNQNHKMAIQLLREWDYQAYSIDDSGGLELCPDIDAYMLEHNLGSDNMVFKKSDNPDN